jgi:RNA polymerase sigma factor (sigma-70 family)
MPDSRDGPLPPGLTEDNRRGLELWRRFRAGDADAFTEIGRLFFKRLMSLFRGFGAPRDVAEDLFQEVMLRLFTARSRYDEKRDLWLFVHTIAKRVAIDWYRRQTIRSPYVAADVDVAELGRSSTLSPEARLVRSEYARLPRVERDIVRLRYLAGLKVSEVAKVLRIKRWVVNQGIAKFKQQLETATGQKRTVRKSRKPTVRKGKKRSVRKSRKKTR